MGVRRLASLVTNLPIGCALHRAEDPNGYGSGWSHTEALLASLIEIVDLGNRQFVRAHTKKGTVQPRPVKIIRPGLAAQKKRQAEPEELAALVGRLGGAKLAPKEASSNGGS